MVVCPPCAVCGRRPDREVWADRFVLIVMPGDWTDELRAEHRRWNEQVNTGEIPDGPPPTPETELLSICPAHALYVRDADKEPVPDSTPLLTPKNDPESEPG